MAAAALERIDAGGARGDEGQGSLCAEEQTVGTSNGRRPVVKTAGDIDGAEAHAGGSGRRHASGGQRLDDDGRRLASEIVGDVSPVALVRVKYAFVGGAAVQHLARNV